MILCFLLWIGLGVILNLKSSKNRLECGP
uniref:Uncharacterized protein n=1 Tax=Rhizophora mucronata TaxID=61149 RepID=A0A2P2P4H0_RHIMU